MLVNRFTPYALSRENPCVKEQGLMRFLGEHPDMSDAAVERRRDEKGRFQASTSPDDVYEAMEPLEPYSTNEVADELGLPHRTALHYLNQLAKNGRIRKKKTGARSVIWVRMEQQ